jgi:DNA polymerase III subunit gamma/tau
MAWYNDYRPQVFEDVIGQNLVKSVLQNALKKDLVKHAYLFSGSKGIGKTTLARIFANELNVVARNPQTKIDIIEMDAASNTGIDDIRQLIDSARIPPLVGKYKIYIIDEVHMLSKNAMNALLKILEEPPLYIVFLLATTNPEKLIPTVLSRLTKLNLSNHTNEDIISRLEFIAQKEDVNIEKDALDLIAKRSDGSQRDAINLLETVSTYQIESYTKHIVAELLGLVTEDIFDHILNAFDTGKVTPETITSMQSTGIDGETILIQLLEFLLDRSFAGSKNYDYIIPVLSKVLSYNLPINAPAHLLSLVLIELSNPKYSRPTNLNNTASATTLTTSTKPKNTKTLEQNTSKIKIQEVSEVTQHLKPIDKFNTATDLVVDLNTLKLLFHGLAQKNDSPPTIKMILPDLSVEKVEANVVTVSVTNGIFLNQLSSSKLSEWITLTLSKDLKNPIKLDVIQRVAAPQPLIEDSVFEEEVFAFEANETETVNAPATVKNNQSTEKQSPKKIQGKVFYKIYRELPPEIADSKIPVYPELVPDPIQQNEKKEENWDEHVDDMFEFE